MFASKHHLHSLVLTGPPALRFGTFLKFLRHRHGIKQKEVMLHLPTWAEENYSRLENGELFPPFDQLVPIACALEGAGVEWTPLERQQFLTLAREKIEAKHTHRERKTEREWDELRLRLARGNWDSQHHHHPASLLGRVPSPPRILETRHLVGREEWLTSVLAALQHDLPKKLIVLQGPVGIGKSSELHRLAVHALGATPRPQVLLCELPAVEGQSAAESALDLVLATLLVEVASPDTAMLTASLDARMTYALTCLEKTSRTVWLLVDNGEQLLDEQGRLSSCWQRFLGSFLRSQHRACLVLATKAWPGWSEGERVFVAEYMIPSLSVEAGAQVLQQLGLASVARKHLRRVSHAVGGVPLCLEWVASLAQEPLLGDDWQGVLDDPGEQREQEARHREALTRRLLHLLKDASLFGGHVAAKLTPLLERILQNRLSAEAIGVLNVLSLANIALGKAAVQRVCSHPRFLKELRDASLLMAYAQHVQLLPMVASLVRSRLSVAQIQHDEERLIDALTGWLHEGKASDGDMGALIAELATLYLKQHRLLEAAQLLIRYGWISFNQGYAPRLARLARDTMQQLDWHTTEENECAGFVLLQILFPFLGMPINPKQHVDYQRIRDTFLAGKLVLQGAMEVYVMHLLMLDAMNELRFEDAQMLVNVYSAHIELRQISRVEQQTVLLEERAWLMGTWFEYTEEQGEVEKARSLREQAIDLYRQCSLVLSSQEEKSLPREKLRKKRVASCLNNLGYYLNRSGQYEEALQMVERSITLKEQGYVYVGALAASYGEKSQVLMELGRFQEALRFDEKAVAEIQRCADAGDALSQEDAYIYQVNRGRLYLRLGRVSEAERLLQEALPHIQSDRRIYRMFAREPLEEIEHWRRQATSAHHQLDWRWVERYRELASYDSYWWLAHAGPFTEEEQQQWDRLFIPPLDEAMKQQLGTLLVQSRERELTTAIAEQRQPRLRYPAIEIDEVRRRIAALVQLDAEISHQEPNAIVRRLYHGTIEEEIDYLRLIEATYEGNTEQFWQCNLRLLPVPSSEEMDYALSHIRRVVHQGLMRPETAEVSQRLNQFMQTHLSLSFAISSHEEEIREIPQEAPQSLSQSQQTVSAQAAKRFFEAALRECGYEGWQVGIDPNAVHARVEAGLRQLFLPNRQFSLDEMRDDLAHELAGHVARCIAGERSPLGLLGINTKNALPTEEGVALYHERRVAALHGQTYDDSGIWVGAFAIGLACGVVTAPQTFLSLFTFLESFDLLHRLLKRPDADQQEARNQAQTYALSVCLRKYRGVPDLEKAGVCYLQDAVYLRGLRMVEQAVAEDATVLDRLAVGKVALELLPDVQELGIVSAAQPLRELAYAADLDAYMLSFEQHEEAAEKPT